MKALLERQQQSQKLRSILAGEESSVEKTVEEKIERCRYLQYEQHQQLFAVQYSTLHKAAMDNSLSGMKYFIHTSNKLKHKHLMEEYDRHGYAGIHYAAEHNSLDVINFLNENGCKMNFLTKYGNSPLMLACKENKIGAIKLLLSLGASLSSVNPAGLNCIHFAAQCNHAESIEAIADIYEVTELKVKQADKREQRGLSRANDRRVEATQPSSDYPFSNDFERVIKAPEVITEDQGHKRKHRHHHGHPDDELPPFERVLRAFNRQSNSLLTPLHLAAMYNCLDSSTSLVLLGAKVNAIDSAGETPLHKAARKGFRDVYGRLMSLGASDTIENNFGETPIDLLKDNTFH